MANAIDTREKSFTAGFHPVALAGKAHGAHRRGHLLMRGSNLDATKKLSYGELSIWNSGFEAGRAEGLIAGKEAGKKLVLSEMADALLAAFPDAELTELPSNNN